MNKSTNIFNSYSEFYDAFYKEKDYKKEIQYILDLLKKFYAKTPESICDAGCGTGKHLKYLENLISVLYGVDSSSKMIEIAKTRCNSFTKFQVGKLSSFKLPEKVESVISLFHVISYVTDSFERQESFSNIFNHLKKEGCFIFDFYYEPAVIKDPPQKRFKSTTLNNVIVERVTTPKLYKNNKLLEINWDFKVKNKNKIIKEFQEVHHMTFFSLSSLKKDLLNVGFSKILFFDWMTPLAPSDNSWYGLCIAIK